MKALVLAGGSGTRLRPFSYSMPKQLIPIANRPVLEYVVRNILDLGVNEIGIIVNSRDNEIQQVLGDGSRFGARLTYIRQEDPSVSRTPSPSPGTSSATTTSVMYPGRQHAARRNLRHRRRLRRLPPPQPTSWCARSRTREPSAWPSWDPTARYCAWWRSRSGHAATWP